jgi:Protein of unknown function (DUF2934)
MPNNASLAPMSEQRIRESAYAIYLARQDQEGNDVSDWLAAEHELQGQGKKTRTAARLALNVGLLM